MIDTAKETAKPVKTGKSEKNRLMQGLCGKNMEFSGYLLLSLLY